MPVCFINSCDFFPQKLVILTIFKLYDFVDKLITTQYNPCVFGSVRYPQTVALMSLWKPDRALFQIALSSTLATVIIAVDCI